MTAIACPTARTACPRCSRSRTAPCSAGTGFGARGEAFGEAVFNTGMAGYQEVLTDPSYAGQIVAMTSPHQGTTASNRDDAESVSGAGRRVRRAGGVTPATSSWRAETALWPTSS